MLTMEEVLKQGNVRFAEEEIVKGKVVEIRQKEVLVDIGYKSEGSISTNEFDEDDPPKVGDEVEVFIERLENREGMVELSHERAEFKHNWDKINSICQEGGRIKGKIKQAVKVCPVRRHMLCIKERYAFQIAILVVGFYLACSQTVEAGVCSWVKGKVFFH